MIRLGWRGVLAALQWLGFVDLSATAPVPVEVLFDAVEPDATLPDVHISLGVFVLSGAPTRA